MNMEQNRRKKLPSSDIKEKPEAQVMTETLSAPARSKRELIVEAGIQVFSQKGYHQAKMEEIAVAAGIGKATIYEYFSSKLQLFQEIMETSIQKYSDIVSTEEISQMNLEERIILITEGHIRFCKQYKDLSRLVFWDTEIIDEELKEWFYIKRKEKEGILENLINDAIQRGEIRQVDAKLMVLMIGGILGQIWVPIVLEGWDMEPAVTARQVTDLIMYGIKK